MVLGSVALYLVGTGFNSTANDEAATAFETYDPALKHRLGLCSNEQPECRKPVATANAKPTGTAPAASSSTPGKPIKPAEDKPVYKPNSSGAFGVR